MEISLFPEKKWRNNKKSMANLSRSPSLIQSRNASPLRKSVDLSSHSPNFSSPSDSPYKNIGLKYSSLEKENEQDPAASIPPKGRSPMMISSPKGPPVQKNFMSPTISASSKAVGPSFQRKRILGERNEMVKSLHTSVTSEENSGLAVRFELESTQVEDTTNISCKSCIASSQIKEAASPCQLGPPKRASSSVGPETATQNHQLQFPHLPPYDPKVNYLSPRPRFLHYKPKARDELFVNELDLLGTNSDSTSSEDSSSSECSGETAEEDNSSNDAVVPQVESPKIEVQQSQAKTMRVKLNIRHVMLVLLISCICLPLSDSPMIASYPNPNVHLVRFVGFHTRILEVSNKFNGWLTECFSYTFPRDKSFPIENHSYLANLTCVVDHKINDVGGEKETIIGFDMIQNENEISEEQIRYEIETLEEEEEIEEEKEEKEIDADEGITSEQPELVTFSFISEVKEDKIQPNLFEKSEPEKPEISELEFAEYQEVKDMETIMSEKPEPKLKEPEPNNVSEEELISISKKTARVVVSISVLLSLVAAVAAKTLAKKKQNRVLVSDSICGGRTRGLVQGSSESNVLNRNSLHIEFSTSSFEVDSDGCIYSSTPRERQARRESEASSGSYGSYMSFEKISSKKGNRDGEEMVTPVRRSSRLRDRTISS